MRKHFAKLFKKYFTAVPACIKAMMRNPVKQVSKFYIIPYDASYHEAVDQLSNQGWLVRLEIDAIEGLHYAVYSLGKKSAQTSHELNEH